MGFRLVGLVKLGIKTNTFGWVPLWVDLGSAFIGNATKSDFYLVEADA